MDRKELMAAFNRPTRLGTLSTADDKGVVNAALFGSAHMTDEETLVIASGDNRTLAYLRKNPKAVFCFFEPAASPFDWTGGRIYLEARSIETQGPLFERLVAEVRKAAGDDAANRMAAAVTFRISGFRPLIDPGA